MKKWFTLFTKTFFFTAIGFALVAIGVIRRLNLQLPYLKLFAGIFIIALLISLAILLFKSPKGNGVLHAVFAFLIILPSVFVLRNVFGIAVFRFSFVIYILMSVFAVLYAIAVIMVSRKAKKETRGLNQLLDENRKEPEKQE